MKVTVDEITQTLVSCGASQLASAIREHGIAPPNGYVLVPVDEASNIIAMRKALEEIIEWTDRYTSPDHPITIFAKKALSAVKEKE